MTQKTPPPLEQVLGSAASIGSSRIEGEGPEGRLPLTAEMLRTEPSGNIFGLTQNAGMGWRPDALGGPQYVIVSTMGGLRSEHGEPIALGYHTGHWEIGLLVRGAAEALFIAATHATGGRRARPACSTAWPTGTMRPSSCGG
jgi:xylonate dehydratase